MTQILKGAHGSPILAVAWHSAGELATACDGGCVAVWDAKRWTVLHAWFSTHPVTCCQFNAHGDLAWGTSCGKVKLRRSPRKSVKEHEDVTLVGHKKALSTLSWRPGVLRSRPHHAARNPRPLSHSSPLISTNLTLRASPSPHLLTSLTPRSAFGPIATGRSRLRRVGLRGQVLGRAHPNSSHGCRENEGDPPGFLEPERQAHRRRVNGPRGPAVGPGQQKVSRGPSQPCDVYH